MLAERSLSIGLLIGSTGGIYSETLVSSLHRTCKLEDIRLSVFHCDFLSTFTEDISEDDLILKLVATKEIDAILISGMVSEKVLKKLHYRIEMREVPIPVITLTYNDPHAYSVLIDNESGLRDLMGHLLDDHGYERIAFLGGPKGQQESEVRKRIYSEELSRRNIPIRQEWIVHGNFLPASGPVAMQELLNASDTSFQGVVCASDEMAVSAIRFLEERGYRVPGDYFFTGFDGFKPSPLTTVCQSVALQMEAAVRLVKNLKAGDVANKLILSPSTLRIKSTCGCTPLAIVGRIYKEMEEGVCVQKFYALLSEACLKSVASGQDSFFLDQLHLLLQEHSGHYDSEYWQGILAILRKETSKYKLDFAQAEGLAYLIDQGFIASANYYFAQDNLLKFKRADTPFQLQRFNQDLGYVLTYERLVEVLCQKLPSSGFINATLAIFRDPGVSVSKAEVIMAYDEDGVKDVPADIAELSVSDIWMKGIPLANKSNLMNVIQPLIYQRTVYGFLTVACSVDLISVIYIISSYISSAIHAIRLWEERLRSEEYLVESEKMAALGKLVAGIAHEINTPIGISLTLASDLKFRTTEIVEHHKNKTLTKTIFDAFVNTVDSETELVSTNLRRAADLISSFKKIAVDQSSERDENFQLAGYLSDIVASLSPVLKQKDHVVQIDCPSELYLYGAPGSVAQIIGNLINNAVLHGFDEMSGGIIKIVCTFDNKHVYIQFTDNGKGMAKDTVKRIFEPFFTTKLGQGGSGLGLHIVYNLVHKLWNGTIRCKSVQGVGTDFFIALPVQGE